MTGDSKEDREEKVGEPGDAAADKMTEEELRAELEKQFRQQQVSDVLMQYMVSLSTLAYVKMGITEDTREVKDLDQARLAIDSFKALLDTAGDRFGDQDQQALSGALASMQMTFVQATEGGAGGAPTSSGEGGASEGASQPDDGAAAGEKKRGDDPASRLWVPGKE